MTLTRDQKLSSLSRLQSALQNVWLVVQEARFGSLERAGLSLWQTIHQEKRVDELRVEKAVNHLLRSVAVEYGSSTSLAELGRRAWEIEKSRVQVREFIRLELKARLGLNIVERLERPVFHELAQGAERSERDIREIMGLPQKIPWSERIKKQVSDWTDVEGVFADEYPELVAQISELLERTVGTNANRVSNIVTEAANPARPLSMQETAARIQDEMPNMSRRQALMISRTETARVYGATQHEQYKRNGMARRQSLTAAGSPAALLSPVCQLCQDIVSQGWIGIEDNFKSDVLGGADTPHPPFHPNCRCDSVGDVEDWLPPLGDEFGDELDDFAAMEIPRRREAWGRLSVRARDKLADPVNSIVRRRQEILSRMAPVDYRRSIKARLSQSEHLISRESRDIAQRHVEDFAKQMKLSGADPRLIRRMSIDMVDDLIVQEYEAMGRTLGDHGIRHLVGDSDMAIDILKAVPGSDTAADFAMMRYTGVYHDMGYLARPGRIFLDEGHLRWGKAYADNVLRANGERAFGKAGFQKVTQIIATHDSTVVNWVADPLASAFRVSDNLALFHRKKLPQLFNLIPENVSPLARLGANEISVKEAQSIMAANINASALSKEVKAQLLRAVHEVSEILPRFTIGQFGGEVRGFAWEADHLIVKLERRKLSNVNASLSPVLDMGQSQFTKLSNTYRLRDYDWTQRSNMVFRDAQGNALFEVRVTRPGQLLGPTPEILPWVSFMEKETPLRILTEQEMFDLQSKFVTAFRGKGNRFLQAQFRLFEDSVRGFTSGASKIVRESAEALVRGAKIPGSQIWTNRAKVLVDAVNSTAVKKFDLYRGMIVRGSVNKVAARFVPGQIYDIPLASASSREAVGKKFAGYGRAPKDHVSVLIRLKDSRGLPLGSVSGFPSEAGLIISGRFQVQSVVHDILSKNTITVTLRQVETLATSTTKAETLLRTTTKLAFNKRQVVLKSALTKKETGDLGEAIAKQFLKESGHINTTRLNVATPNAPIDLIAGKRVVEVKAGLVSNGRSAWQWRASLGEPGIAEKRWLAQATAKEKTTHNVRKLERALSRKSAKLRALSKELGVDLESRTLTMIINPDTMLVDIYDFKGFHSRIGWTTARTRRAYRGTFDYSRLVGVQ